MSRSLKNERIAVLAGGTSCEREISLLSGRNVMEALRSCGLPTLWVDPAPPTSQDAAWRGGVDAAGDFMSQLKHHGTTLAFLALHGTFGEDGTVQRLLDAEGILYTGPGPRASELAFDKSQSQKIFKKAGVHVPDFAVYADILQVPAKPPFDLPVVVKPAKSGSSVGITIVSSIEDHAKALAEAFRYSDIILIEKFIPGRELTVSILGEEPLPIVEIIVQRKFYDYEAKYREAGTRYEVPAKLSRTEAEKVNAGAMSAYRALGCEMMSRADLILAENGHAYVLELNTIPGLTAKSLLPKAARQAGIDFPELCVRILTMALLNKKAVKTNG